MNHARALLAIALLLALAGACSEGGPAAGPTTTVPTSTSTPGLGDLMPFPPDLLPAGCAAETTRDLAVFRAALEAGPTLEELCTVVGLPDWLTGSGLLIAVYDLDDGGQIMAGYGGPLMYARWVGPDGEVRPLFGE